jgi:spore maturation protein CgeB
LIQKEVIGALNRLPGVKVLVLDITDRPTIEQAEKACSILKENKCNVVFTINEWGLDEFGIIARYLEKKSALHINWCVDDPFFLEIFHNRSLKNADYRLDFVSNRAYVGPLLTRGFNAHFLPLAADPSMFFPLSGPQSCSRDLCFVGNSYRKQLDEFCAGHDDFLQSLVPFMGETLKMWESDVTTDICAEVVKKIVSSDLPPSLPARKAIFIVKHFISYLFRKRFVCSLAMAYPDFMVFGDEFWLCDLPKEKVSLSVGYYANLNQTYGQTKINLDINRIVITEGLTQRVFDCLAGGNFILTNRKSIIGEFFHIDGQDREVVVFDNELHCRELIDYFLFHEDQRRTIAQRGRKRVLLEHTYDHRVHSIFSVLSNHVSARKK